MSKKVLAAAIVRDYQFDSLSDCWFYLYRLDARKVEYQLLSKCRLDDGRVLLRIMHQYNGNDLIQLYDDQRTMFHDEQYAYCQRFHNADGFISCGNCRWSSICNHASEYGCWEYCERFDAQRGVPENG